MVIRQRLSDVAKQLGRSPATGLSLEVENSLRTTVHLITGLRFRSILFTGDSFQFAFSLSTTCFKIILSYGRRFPSKSNDRWTQYSFPWLSSILQELGKCLSYEIYGTDINFAGTIHLFYFYFIEFVLNVCATYRLKSIEMYEVQLRISYISFSVCQVA